MTLISHYALNGAIVPADKAKLHVTDLGLLRGYSVFDFFPVAEGVPLFVDDYLQRFFASASRVHLGIPFTKEDVLRQVEKVITANSMQEGALRLLLTGGCAADGLTAARPNFVIMAHKGVSYPTAMYRAGAALITQEYERFLPEVKTTNYLVSMLLQEKMQDTGAVDVLFHHGGRFTEAARSSFFLVTREHIVITSPQDVLPGITRLKVLALSGERFRTQEQTINVDALHDAAEAFITSSTKGVMPITRIDDEQIGQGTVGPVTRALMQALAQTKARYVAQQRARS